MAPLVQDVLRAIREIEWAGLSVEAMDHAVEVDVLGTPNGVPPARRLAALRKAIPSHGVLAELPCRFLDDAMAIPLGG